MRDENSDGDSERNPTDGRWLATRRRALQLAGVGVGSLALPGVTARSVEAATDCAEGPFERSYSGATVNLGRLRAERGGNGTVADADAKRPVSDREVERLRAKTSGEALGGPVGRAQRASETGHGLTTGTEYDGVGYEGTRGLVPSDSQIATGRSKNLHLINSQFAIYNKRSGRRQLKLQLEDIFEPVIEEPEGGFVLGYPFVFDPRARYDRGADRFVVAATQYQYAVTEDGEVVDREEQEERAREGEDPEGGALQRGPKGWWVVAVSATGNPNGKWHVYRIPPIDNDGLVDYPALGLDEDAVYLTQNFFGEGVEVTMVTLDKAALYAGEDVTGHHFTGLDNPNVGGMDFTVQPALQPFSGGSDGTYYLLNSVYPSPTADALTLWEVTDPIGDPTLECFTVDVEEFGFPPTARQPGSERRIDTIGTRLMNLDYDDGSLWTAHTIRYDWNGDGTPVAAVKWYEIDADTRRVVRSGVYGEPGRSYFIPTVGAEDGETVITHNVSGPDTYPRMEVAGRTATDAPNELADSVVVREGESPYDYGEGEESMRWGDYNGVSVDPTTGRFWTVSQYSPDIDLDPSAEERDPYHTRIAEVYFDGS